MFIKLPTLLVCVMTSVLMLAVALNWLVKPFDQYIWRIKLPMPFIQSIAISTYSFAQLSTSSPVRFLLNHSVWRTPYGLVTFYDKAGSMEVVCQNCTLNISELSKQSLHLDQLNFTVQRNGQHLSGWVLAMQNKHQSGLSYTGTFDMRGIALSWALRKTQVTELISVLKTHSQVLQKADVHGSFSAVGSLNLPSGNWSVNPDLRGFSVSGLGTAQLKTARVKYRCSTQSNSGQNLPYRWLGEKELGRWLPRAVIIAEDAHFREHPGYNLDAIRSILAQSSRRKQLGGSTITQQLAKNFFTGGERTWLRKLEELLYAVEMENTLGKQRIFELYINTVDWGPGVCGAAQAAQVYFNRNPAQLSPLQAAWLAGIIRNPHHAWDKQFVTYTPDLERAHRIMGFMPKRARSNDLKLKFIAYHHLQ